ncbi:hypothetical protein AVEN_125040-1 [Araneus ventricosus]|uniref:Uncharacterized protein n=1 Tax=Araneus ventricosus TaxID=182803 RepID=A0A4Y2GZM7_ARAVE|nr:hypothetical protein AVEN_125040-1 [Araneus ventricosus]
MRFSAQQAIIHDHSTPMQIRYQAPNLYSRHSLNARFGRPAPKAVIRSLPQCNWTPSAKTVIPNPPLNAKFRTTSAKLACSHDALHSAKIRTPVAKTRHSRSLPLSSKIRTPALSKPVIPDRLNAIGRPAPTRVPVTPTQCNSGIAQKPSFQSSTPRTIGRPATKLRHSLITLTQ